MVSAQSRVLSQLQGLRSTVDLSVSNRQAVATLPVVLSPFLSLLTAELQPASREWGG